MATTRIIKHYQSKGESIADSLAGRIEYGKNPDKTDRGEWVRSYECDRETADAEFVLAKAQYHAITGREQQREKDVLCYQIRQAFKPGEVTAEQANAIGYELAMRWTKGNHAFLVATHVDKEHIHNHIYYNSTTLDCKHKFRDFKGSARALRKLSDRICLEHSLSVIQEPQLHSKGKYRHYGEWLKDGGQKKKASLAIDIQEKMRAGKGLGYIRWATVYNLKQMAAAVQYLQESKIQTYEELESKAVQITEHCNSISENLMKIEKDMSGNAELKRLIVEYAKTRPIFGEYKNQKYSKKYLAEHEEEITAFRKVQMDMRNLLNGGKLPKIDALKSEWQKLLSLKKSIYADYRESQKSMKEILTIKSNIDLLLGISGQANNKEMER